MYGKLINGVFQVAPKILKTIISNPTKEQYREHGYKPVLYETVPEINENQYLEESFVESDSEIKVTYEVKEYEQINESEENQ